MAELRGVEVGRVAAGSGLPGGLVAQLRQLAWGRDTKQVPRAIYRVVHLIHDT